MTVQPTRLPIGPRDGGGCEVADACQACPLPRCRYDLPGRRVGRVIREQQAAVLVAGGATYPQVATALGVSRRTAYRLTRRALPVQPAPLRGERACPPVLTPRQRAVLARIAEGDTVAQVAGRLGMTGRTVKYHLLEIRARLGAANTIHAAIIAERRGWLTEVAHA